MAHPLYWFVAVVVLGEVFVTLLEGERFLGLESILIYLFVLRELGLEVVQMSWRSLVLMKSVDMLV